jgi:hypothetical protein
MKRLFITHLIVLLLLVCSARVCDAAEQTFKTKYTTIHYKDDKDLDDFLWRLGGTRIDIIRERELASNRVDRIVERVEAIVDMRPKDLNIDVYLQRGDLKYNEIAYYGKKAGGVYISVDKASDGVFAHEITHAIVNKYFMSSAPSKVQEIISQYVDRYLWSEY